MQKLVLVIFLFTLVYRTCLAQEVKDSIIVIDTSKDSLRRPEVKTPGVFSVLFKGKPGKAFLYSLILPGAGQVYNHSYWKVPIIYTSLGLLVYAINFNSRNYKRFDNAYHLRVDATKYNTDHPLEPPLAYTDEFKNILDLAGINSYRQYYDKNLQLSYIGIGIVYLLNGIEAFVDRHLQEFDVSKNLSLQYTPSLYSSAGQITIRMTF